MDSYEQSHLTLTTRTPPTYTIPTTKFAGDLSDRPEATATRGESHYTPTTLQLPGLIT